MEALDGQISQKPLRNSEMDFLGGLIMLQIIFLHISLTYTSVSWIKDFYKLWEYTLPCLGWYFFKGGMFYKHKKFRDVISGCTQKTPDSIFFLLDSWDYQSGYNRQPNNQLHRMDGLEP